MGKGGEKKGRGERNKIGWRMKGSGVGSRDRGEGSQTTDAKRGEGWGGEGLGELKAYKTLRYTFMQSPLFMGQLSIGRQGQIKLNRVS